MRTPSVERGFFYVQGRHVFETVRELNSSFVNYVLTTIEVAIGEEGRKEQLKAIRKLVLDRHNDNLRELKNRLEKTQR